MKFFIDGKIMTSEDQPLVVILTEQDRKNIANMVEGATVYSIFQKDSHTVEEIEKLLMEAKEKGAS